MEKERRKERGESRKYTPCSYDGHKGTVDRLQKEGFFNSLYICKNKKRKKVKGEKHRKI
ncbi:MAG: hypothetical protein WBA22_05785 [Candidatus Methanofastidiosia archaeon]